MQLYEAHRHRNARPVPKVRRTHFQENLKEGLHVLCLRARRGLRLWDVPVKDVCPSCGKTLFKLSGKGARKPFCINSECDMFVPEEKRGYRRKAAADKTAEKPKEKPVKTKDTPKEDK